MTWNTISENETRAGAEVNQSLMDKLRENSDDVHGISASLINIHDTDSVAGGGGAVSDIVIDDSIDWRDRNINIRGIIVAGDTSDGVGDIAADVAAIQPGGGQDNDVYFQVNQGISGTPTALTGRQGAPTFTALNAALNWGFIDGWLYSGAGGADYTVLPYLELLGYLSATARPTNIRIWVDSTDGKLWLSFSDSGTGFAKHAGWNLQITYSENLGGV